MGAAFLRRVGSHKRPGYCNWIASSAGAERLPNGNTLICNGEAGRIFEVTPGGEVVWDYVNAFGASGRDGRGGGPPNRGPGNRGGRGPGGRGPGSAYAIFRAVRLAQDHPGLKGRDLSPKEPAGLADKVASGTLTESKPRN